MAIRNSWPHQSLTWNTSPPRGAQRPCRWRPAFQIPSLGIASVRWVPRDEDPTPLIPSSCIPPQLRKAHKALIIPEANQKIVCTACAGKKFF